MQRFIFVFLAAVLCSCGEHIGSAKYYSKDIIGWYKCTVAEWMHPMAIDINNDGVVGRDLMSEVESITMADIALKRIPVRITDINGFDTPSDYIYVQVPHQGLFYEESSDTYIPGLTTDFFYFYFTYSIDTNGDIRISRPVVEDLGLSYVQLPGNKDVNINQLGNNVLDYTIITTFYDFNSQRFVTGPVHYRYERIYSDPYETSWKTLVK